VSNRERLRGQSTKFGSPSDARATSCSDPEVGVSSRPLPDLRNAGAPFFSHAARGVLALPRCIACARAFWPPRPRCPRCASSDVEWTTSGGQGTIHTFTIVRQSGDPHFRTKVPYAVAMIDLDEGVRVMSNVVDTPLETLHIGQRVEGTFEPAADGIAIPLFRVAPAKP
jgi:uncharacterized OB-fold protein